MYVLFPGKSFNWRTGKAQAEERSGHI